MYYRQHLIVLVAGLCECALLGCWAALALRLGCRVVCAWLLALLEAARRGWAWAVFCVWIRGQQMSMRSLRGLTVREEVVSFSGQEGLRMQQTMLGWLLDYGDLQIQAFGRPVRFLYIASCSVLRRQIDRSA